MCLEKHHAFFKSILLKRSVQQRVLLKKTLIQKIVQMSTMKEVFSKGFAEKDLQTGFP